MEKCHIKMGPLDYGGICDTLGTSSETTLSPHVSSFLWLPLMLGLQGMRKSTFQSQGGHRAGTWGIWEKHELTAA